jgi:predicted phosphoadenosine phosphosulfate sulfurtransferase
MDSQIMTNRWSREELQLAHDNFAETANRCAASGEWRDWANLFTEDAEYVEHMFGNMHGREAIHTWIAATMAEWPNKAMTSFPHAWCSCDEEKGWWICRIENRFRDPGDGSVHQAHNITVLRYAGDMQFSYEEDAYNPANFGPVVVAWLAANEANGGATE